MKNRIITIAAVAAIALPAFTAGAQQTEPIKFGDFNQWLTREIKESSLIGGKTQKLYEIGPKQTLTGNKAYKNVGGSPWATCNVYAKTSGIEKASWGVEPFDRGGGNMAARMTSRMDHVKALGVVNMDIMVTGTVFLGEMVEPVTSQKNPYSKMDMGIPYTKRPKSLVLDYKVDMPQTDFRIKASGIGKKKKIPGRDTALAMVLLQKRWEDKDGNIHALRVGSGGEIFSESTGWVNGHKVPIVYGDNLTGREAKLLALRSGEDAFYARNSKGKMVPVIEEGWADAGEAPTHVVVQLCSGSYGPYIGTEGISFYADNVAFGF